MAGLTFDTGVLLALERRQQRAGEVFATARARKRRITVPAVVVTEWWRGRSDLRDALLLFVDVELLTPRLAKIAGEAIASVEGATAVDAIVMASAAQRGDVVYTSDFDDLQRLRRQFPAVKVLRI